MALPADFSKIYGSTATGGLTPISDVNYAKGWEFAGSNPPTKNDFSYLQNLSDLKSQWLYLNKLQRSNPFGDIKSDGAAAVSTALENLGLGEAAKQDVATSTQMQAGTATDLLPSVAAVMSLFSKRSFATNDFIRIPDVPGGLIIQWGEAATSPSSYFVNFPMMFPTSCFGVVLSDRAAATTVGSTNRTQSGFQLVSSFAGTTLSFFIAIGR